MLLRYFSNILRLPMNYYIAEKVQCEFKTHVNGTLLLLMRIDNTLSKECV